MLTQRVPKWEEWTPMQKAVLFRHVRIWKEPKLTAAQETWINKQLNLTAERRQRAINVVTQKVVFGGNVIPFRRGKR